MNVKRICLFLLMVLLFFGCEPTSEDLPNGESVTWTSSHPNIVSVSSDGTVTALGFGSGGNSTFVSGPATGTATITASIAGRSGGEPQREVGTPAEGTLVNLGNFSTSSGAVTNILDEFNGKTNVLHVAPSFGGYSWAVLTYSLSAYANREITISISTEVWLDTPAKIAWQVNRGDNTYPVIAGSTEDITDEGSWQTIEGSATITPLSNSTLYLSSQQLGHIEAYFANFTMTIYDDSETNIDDPSLTEGPLLLTIGDSRKLTFSGTSTETFTVIATTEAQVNLMNLPPMKDQFSQYFLMGNIVGNPNAEITGMERDVAIGNQQLLRHYNALTAENHMKPSYLVSGRSGTTFNYNANGLANADRFVNAAINSGFHVVGHTILWHSQNGNANQNGNAINGIMPGPNALSPEDALTAMRNYITYIVTHFKGRVHTWDVLNEVFPDSVQANNNWRDVMRTGGANIGNPWYVAIGADFVYEGFLAARLADPDAILYYNDYNTDQLGKATMIRNMVRDVNERYKEEYPNETRLLIEGIGMQEHHNTGVQTANIKRSLDLFRPLGVRISVSELDVLAQGWSQFSPVGDGTNKQEQSTVTNDGLIDQARLYGEYMKLYIQYSDIIERVSLWGVTDGQSWRSGGLPLLFDPDGRAKPAYYSMINALN